MNLIVLGIAIVFSLAVIVAVRIIVQRALDRAAAKSEIDYNAWVAHIDKARQMDFDTASDELQDRIDMTRIH